MMDHKLICINGTVNLGYNDHGYNEFKAIMSKKKFPFLAKSDHFST